MKKSNLSIAAALVTAAVFPMLLVGCAATDTNANNSSDNNNSINAELVAKDDKPEEEDYTVEAREELGIPEEPGNIEEIEVEEAFSSDIEVGSVNEYAGWYKVAFANNANANGDEDYFMCSSATGIPYSAEFLCDVLEKNLMGDGDGNEFLTGDKDARELAERSARDMGTEMKEKKIGSYTWYMMSIDDEDGVYCYADIAQDEYAYICIQGVPLDSPEVNAILSSFEVLPGDPYQNHKDWIDSHQA